jgi:hypothetical protein
MPIYHQPMRASNERPYTLTSLFPLAINLPPQSSIRPGPARPVGGDRWLPTEPYGRLVGYAVAQLGTASRDWHWHMSQACGDAYSRTLERWHGWLATFEFLGTYYSLSKGVVC